MTRYDPRSRASGTAFGGRRRVSAPCILAALSLTAATRSAPAQTPGASDWGYYGGDALGQHFSSLDQINRGNVARLAPAWSYRSGELGGGFASAGKLTFEATPVLAFGRLYLETATNVVIALDPESGRELWRFDPHIDRARRYAEASARGVSAWAASDAAGGVCRRRIFTGTLDARLLALDADTGHPCDDFGAGGQVDLTRGLRIRDAGAYLVTSPPAVFGKVVIVGSAIGDNRAADVERGVIHAYDAESGAQLWSFDPLPDSASHPAADRLEPRAGAEHGRRQCLGRDVGRPRARTRAGTNRLREPGLLRWSAPRYQPLRRLTARARCAQRAPRVAAAADPPRPVGLRPGRAARAR